MQQRTLGLRLQFPEGKNSSSRFSTEFLNTPRKTVSADKLLSDLLKRQGRRIVTDITECPPGTVAAHMARLDDWRDTVEHLLRHDYHQTPESRLSGRQLIYADTLADWLAVAQITRREHRAPAFVNSRDEQLARLDHKMDLIGGLLSHLTNQSTPEVFTNTNGEHER